MTLSGKTVTRTWEYIPEDIIAVPSKIDFGLLKPGDKVTKQFTLKNPTNIEVTINKLKLKRNLKEFIIESKDFPCTIAAGMSKTIDVSATAIKDVPDFYYDYVIAELPCYDIEIDTLSFKSGDPIVWIADANWGTIPVNVERVKTVEIINQGSVPVILDKMDWQDKVHFPRIENLNLPITLQKGETHEFQVYYKADVPGVTHKTTALFEGNTTKTKLYSDWEGQGMIVGTLITSYNWYNKKVDEKLFDDPILGYKGFVELSAIGNTKLINVNVKIENDVDGVFSFNQSEVPHEIVGDAVAIPLTVYFKPKTEKAYTALITLSGEFNSSVKSFSAVLKGNGIATDIDNSTISNLRNFEITPNPTKDYIDIKFNDPKLIYNYQLKLINLDGTIILSKEIIGENQRIIFNKKIPTGVYFIELIDNSSCQIFSKKIIIE
jgi:hypothetical protein